MQLKQFRELRPRRRRVRARRPCRRAGDRGRQTPGRTRRRTAQRCAPDAALGDTLHAWVYRRSGGRVLGRIGGRPYSFCRPPVAAPGRPTPRRCSTWSTATRSSWWPPTPAPAIPAWYLNLRADPSAHIEVVGRSAADVRAQEATGQERAELWQRLTAANRSLERAARKARRDLPLIHLVAATPNAPRQATDRS